MKVLIISYYWPPAGGPGVQRWLKFCTYLPENGVTPVVYIPENPTYPITDAELLKEVPEAITVIKRPIWEPYSLGKLLGKQSTQTLSKGIIDNNPTALKKLLLFIRGNLFIPDARKAWVKPSVNYLKEHLQQEHYDAVITTGPPHSLHLIGLKLKQALDIKWVADFRDPWTTIGYHKELRLLPWNANKHKRLEKEVLSAADQLIVTSPATKTEFAQLTKKPIAVITNGYDLNNKPKEAVALETSFSIAHIGSLLARRNPETLWKVLAGICKKDDDFKKDLKLVFAGVVAEQVKESLKTYGLFACAEFLGYIEHKEAIKLQHQSQLLLLLEIDAAETRAILPGKLYEYMMAERPVLALGPQGSAIEQLLKKSGSGTFFAFGEMTSDQLSNYLIEAYAAYKTGKLGLKNTAIEAYDRRVLTRKLANLLKSETLARHEMPIDEGS